MKLSRQRSINVGVSLTAAAALVLVAGACAAPEPLKFADWTLPVPAGTPVREYAPVPLAERTELAFELVDDLVIGGDPANPDTAFYRPIAVVAAANGNVFVVENGNKRVQMFGPDGVFLKTLGRPGQGPGEFQMPMAATIAGDRLVVVDTMNSRFSVWADNGDHVADHAIPFGTSAMRIAGLPDGRLAVLSSEIDMASLGNPPRVGESLPPVTTVLSTYSDEGERLIRLLAVGNPPMPNPAEMINDPRARIQYMIDRNEAPLPGFSVGNRALVYVALGTEYQVHAMAPDGTTAWALRVALRRRPIPESSKELRVKSLAGEEPELGVDDFEWPELDAAISRTMRTDGAGRLYVYPLFERPAADQDTPTGVEETAETATEPETPRGPAVDVYSPDGELLVSGLSPGVWSYARGEFVYRIGRDPETDEPRVIRSRLILRER